MTALLLLANYVASHTECSECRCEACAKSGNLNWKVGALKHTADMVFFDVSIRGVPDVEKLRKLIDECKKELDIFDELERTGEISYINLGGWIGDQNTALRLMGMGWLMGLWDCMTPRMIHGLPEELVQQMAGAGLVSIVKKRQTALQPD
jgi:hypothetical protein